MQKLIYGSPDYSRTGNRDNPRNQNPGSYGLIYFFAEVAVPTPMTEEVTTCVALIGRPVVFAKVTTKKVAICDAKEFFMFILQIFIPTVFIIWYPPVIVP